MLHQYMKMKYGPKVPEEEVTLEEFVAAQVATGIPEADARFNADISQKLGAATQVGDRLLRVKT